MLWGTVWFLDFSVYGGRRFRVRALCVSRVRLLLWVLMGASVQGQREASRVFFKNSFGGGPRTADGRCFKNRCQFFDK